ncbi:polyprenol monophosphomannose synthase [Candidatus Bathyarchaeota archaeon]|nr:polyprenol monophosphomannose synthase [Candidatus Bathyarchaeota archaeon]
MGKKVTVITPVYNECRTLRENIDRIQESLRDVPHEIIIVDDNSPDGSGDIADGLAEQTNNITVLHRQSKQGLGTAYKQGYSLASGDLVVSIDSDLSHDPSYLPAMIEAIEGADLVIGSRLVAGGSIVGRSRWRDCLSVLTNTVIRFFTSVKIYDWTSGLRVYRRELWDSVMPSVHCGKWDFQFESLYKTLEHGYRVREVPITFYERADGESKFSLREGLIFLYSFLRILLKMK